ncbi:MAG: hypothetical protein ACK56I_35765, partial [bacterium]
PVHDGPRHRAPVGRARARLPGLRPAPGDPERRLARAGLALHRGRRGHAVARPQARGAAGNHRRGAEVHRQSPGRAAARRLTLGAGGGILRPPAHAYPGLQPRDAPLHAAGGCAPGDRPARHGLDGLR